MIYDLQGKPIKVGSLVAIARGPGSMKKGRVEAIHPVMVRVLGHLSLPKHLVVLEEPVWPN